VSAGKRVPYRRWAWVHITDARLLIILGLVVAVLSWFTYQTATTTGQTDRAVRDLRTTQAQLDATQRQINNVCRDLDTSHAKINAALMRLAAAAETSPGRTPEQREANADGLRALLLADLTCPP